VCFDIIKVFEQNENQLNAKKNISRPKMPVFAQIIKIKTNTQAYLAHL
jgi:hypothetical protein